MLDERRGVLPGRVENLADVISFEGAAVEELQKEFGESVNLYTCASARYRLPHHKLAEMGRAGARASSYAFWLTQRSAIGTFGGRASIRRMSARLMPKDY